MLSWPLSVLHTKFELRTPCFPLGPLPIVFVPLRRDARVGLCGDGDVRLLS